MSKKLGLPLMPWQEQIALVGGELVEHERIGILVPAYREVVVTVPRQNGKTTLVLSWEIQRALGWGSPQKIAYSAQSGQDARKKLVEDQFPVLEPRKKLLGIKRLRRANGNEGIDFANGSRLGLLASTEDSGHGKTLDLAIKDELFADTDDRRDQTLVPAMATKAAAQVLTCSTMGTEESIPWNATVERGRATVESGKREGTAYFEYSALPDTDPADEDDWWTYMPALGLTIDLSVVRHARETLKPSEFDRAFRNIPTKSDERLIPVAAWSAVQTTEHKIEAGAPLAFAVDVNPERTASSITAATVAAGTVEDRNVIEIPTGCDRDGIDWLVDRCAELQSKHPRAEFGVDGSGPAASIVPDLERRGVRVRVLSAKDVVVASAALFDSIVEGRVWVRSHPALNDAVAGAVKRTSGDAWAFARRSAQVNVTPLMAATVALAVARSGASVGDPNFVDLEDFLDEAD